MSKYKVLDINKVIKVKLTDYGKEIYNEYLKNRYDELLFSIVNENGLLYDKDGYLDITLIRFIVIFGKYFKPGMNRIIENEEIIINKDNLEKKE